MASYAAGYVRLQSPRSPAQVLHPLSTLDGQHVAGGSWVAASPRPTQPVQPQPAAGRQFANLRTPSTGPPLSQSRTVTSRPATAPRRYDSPLHQGSATPRDRLFPCGGLPREGSRIATTPNSFMYTRAGREENSDHYAEPRLTDPPRSDRVFEDPILSCEQAADDRERAHASADLDDTKTIPLPRWACNVEAVIDEARQRNRRLEKSASALATHTKPQQKAPAQKGRRSERTTAECIGRAVPERARQIPEWARTAEHSQSAPRPPDSPRKQSASGRAYKPEPQQKEARKRIPDLKKSTADWTFAAKPRAESILTPVSLETRDKAEACEQEAVSNPSSPRPEPEASAEFAAQMLLAYEEKPREEIGEQTLGSLQTQARAEVLRLCRRREEDSNSRQTKPTMIPSQRNSIRAPSKGTAPGTTASPPGANGPGQSSTAGAPAQPQQASTNETELEWSGFSDTAKQALKQWKHGCIGGRHCMLILEHTLGAASSTALLRLQPEPHIRIREGAMLNALTGMHLNMCLVGTKASRWFFDNVFAKSPDEVLADILDAMTADAQKRQESSSRSPTIEQSNLALRRRFMQAHYRMCAVDIGSSQDEKDMIKKDVTSIQVWLELLRLHTEDVPGASQATLLAQLVAQPTPVTASVSRDEGTKDVQERAVRDEAVLRELTKATGDIEAESKEMPLDTIRAQNRAIEDYVMHLVRRRDELRSVLKLVEERDSYFILGLEGTNPSIDEVKKAYRNLARKEHPDKAGCKLRFQAIQTAYTSIMNQMREDEKDGGIPAPSPEGSPKCQAKAADEYRFQLDEDRAVSKASPADSDQPGLLVQDSSILAKAIHDHLEQVSTHADVALDLRDQGNEIASGVAGNRPKAVRVLHKLTEQASAAMQEAAHHLRIVGDAIKAMARCAETLVRENADTNCGSFASVGILDRGVIVDDVGTSVRKSAELLESIVEATGTTLQKVERVSSENDDAQKLLRIGMRLLRESIARIAAVVRRSADETINAAIKAFDLHQCLMAADLEARRERQKNRQRQASAGSDPAGDEQSSSPSPRNRKTAKAGEEERRPLSPRSTCSSPRSSPRDTLRAASSRVKDQHVVLRLKNLRFLATLNEECLKMQTQLRCMAERTGGALLPDLLVNQKLQVFELIIQVLQFSTQEFFRFVAKAQAPASLLEKALQFALSLNYCNSIAMPADPRTQALKLAALVDVDLLCEVVDVVLKTRLLGWLDSVRSQGNIGPVQARVNSFRSGKVSLGKGPGYEVFDRVIEECCQSIKTGARKSVAGSTAEGLPG
eukprot:TRINITY_DN31580_c0_g2_i1.p1 TRINITY_DN31580_c0_g2~~TRINITY_DN31580_c0_g2_i1.p1  ORF type:complete len:1289 (+),score=169.40 TRINITY_DN31580_c0_g2_i1:101-3967(+)